MVPARALLDTEVRYVTADGEPVVTTVVRADLTRVVWGRPVRRVRSGRGQRHYSGLFWSATNSAHVGYESRLELDRLWLADFDSGVWRLAAQPLWFCGQDGPVTRRHVPDLLLHRRDGSFHVVDVKPAKFVDQPDVAAVLAWTGKLCAALGWGYEVWSGADPTRLANIRWIGRARRPGLLCIRAVDAAVEAWRPGVSVGELAGLVDHCTASDGAGSAAVLAALWTGELCTDLSRPLDVCSVVDRREAA